jgi:hypothetical protein
MGKTDLVHNVASARDKEVKEVKCRRKVKW